MTCLSALHVNKYRTQGQSTPKITQSSTLLHKLDIAWMTRRTMCDHVMKNIIDVIADCIFLTIALLCTAFISVWCGKDSIAWCAWITLVFLLPLEVGIADDEYIVLIIVVKTHATVFLKELELVDAEFLGDTPSFSIFHGVHE